MALQVRRHGRFANDSHEGAGRGKPALEEDVRRERLKAEIVEEVLTKKWLHRLNVGRWCDGPCGAVSHGQAAVPSIWHHPDLLPIQRETGRGNNLIAEWLVWLRNNQRNWGFGLCFLYLLNVKGFKWNYERSTESTANSSETPGLSRAIVWCARNCCWPCRLRSTKAGRWNLCMTSLPMDAGSVCSM